MQSRSVPAGHALHLPGVDHEQLLFYHNSIPPRLTDVRGHVVKEILS